MEREGPVVDRDDDRTASLAADGLSAPTRSYLGPAPAPGPGETVGRYRIDAVLGRGGEGIVLAAHDPLLDRPVALKVLRPERRAERERLLREGQAIAKLRHSNVVTVHDVGEHGADLFIAMELVRGHNLRAWLAGDEARARGWRGKLAVVVEAGRGLAAAHAAGLVHGDFKPENVLVADDGHVVVGDFGLARASEAAAGAAAADPTHLVPAGLSAGASGGVTGAVHGTPAYLAPEQWRGRPSTAASDQFAFAVTVHEALFGCRPFDTGGEASFKSLAEAVQAGRRVDLTAHDVPRRQVRAIDRALAADPAARFVTLTALLDELAPARRRWLLPAVTAMVTGGAVIAAVVVRDAARIDPRAAACDRAAARVDAVWNDATRAAHRARHDGATWIDEQLGWLDGYARAWADLRLATCKGQAALTGTEPGAAGACLDRALDALAAAAGSTSAAWPELPALRDCLAPLTVRPQSRSLAFGPQGFPVLSPDGREVAISSFSGDAYIATLDAPVAPRPVAGAREILDWRDDGALFVSRADNRYELVAADGAVTLVARMDVFVPRASKLAPDGRHVAFERATGVEIREVATGAVIGNVAGSPAFTSWEPDGRRLSIAPPSGDIVLFDTATRTTTSVPSRTGIGPFGVRDTTWLRRGELALSGQLAGPDQRGGLWTIELDDAGRIRSAPTLRLTPEPAITLLPSDQRAGRLAMRSFSSKQRTFQWRDGRERALRSVFDHTDVVAYDAAGRRALSRRDDELLLYPLDAATMPTTLTVAPGSFAFRGSTMTTLRAGDRGRWRVIELDDHGREHARAELTWDAGTPSLACDHASAGACVIVGERAGVMVAAPLVGDGLGREVALPGMRGGVAVSTDGKRWVTVRDHDGAVVELEAATGRVLTAHVVSDRDCFTFGAGWRTDAPGIWARYACADRFALVHGPIEGAYPAILEGDGWMSGVVAIGADAYLYSVQDNDAALVIVDGL